MRRAQAAQAQAAVAQDQAALERADRIADISNKLRPELVEMLGLFSGEFVQVFREALKGPKKRPGKWLMRKEDFDRLRVRCDAARLFKDWFASMDPPTHFRIVGLNRTVDVRVGIASQHRKLGDGNGIQLQILGDIDTSWFRRPQLIQ